MQEFSKFLKNQRESKGIRLEEIASITKIHLHSLELLESGNWSKLPGEPFIRGFIAAYAKYIGLDPNETLRQFYEIQGVKTQPVLNPPEVLASRKPTPKPPVSTPQPAGTADTPTKMSDQFAVPTWVNQKTLVWVGSVTGVLLFAGILLYVGGQYRKQNVETKAGSQASRSANGHAVSIPIEDQIEAQNPELETAPTESKPLSTILEVARDSGVSESRQLSAEGPSGSTAKELENNTPQKIDPSEAKHEIQIENKERTWIKVVIDDGQPYESFMEPGQTVSYHAKEKIKVVLGNSTDAKVYHNQEPVEGVKFLGTIRSYRFPANARFPQDVPSKRNSASTESESKNSP